jgi:hypothetical protein
MAACQWNTINMNEIYTILQNFNKVAEPVAEETVIEAVEFDPQEFEYIMDEIANLADQALGMLPPGERSAAEAYWYPHILGAIGGHHGSGYMGGSMHTMANSLRNAESGRDEDEDEDEAWESIENTAQNLLK